MRVTAIAGSVGETRPMLMRVPDKGYDIRLARFDILMYMTYRHHHL